MSQMVDFDPIAYINEPRWLESRLGLERIRELLDRLGNPQDSLCFVHVAGTNGKGSTCAFVASILQTSGYKTGLFTSPYILEFSDRIKVDGNNISSTDLYEVTLSVKQVADAMADHPTEFELMTAVALMHFARLKCEIVVLEVGMGGRLDSTNVIAPPEVCVISSIAYDHISFLGDTLEKIASEKAGIIKEGVPVVSWPQDPEAQVVIEREARNHHSTLRIPDFEQLIVHPLNLEQMAAPSLDLEEKCENEIENGNTPRSVTCSVSCGASQSVSRETFVRLFSYKHYKDLEIQLLGNYQPFNATLAIEVIEQLRFQGWNIPDDVLRNGLAATQWPGRFEIVSRNPTFIIDGGHNLQGVQALAASLREMFPHKKAVFIIGVLDDKDYSEMLDEMLPLGSVFIVIEPPSPRALPVAKLAQVIAEKLAEAIASQPAQPASLYQVADIPDAVAKAFELAGSQGLICAFGSLYSLASLKDGLTAHNK